MTGYSRDQLKRRLALLSAYGCDGVHRGARGALLIPEDLAQLLKKMVEFERQGLSPTEAMTLALNSAHERPRAQENTFQAPQHNESQESSGREEKDMTNVLTAVIVLQALNLFVLLVLLFFMTR